MTDQAQMATAKAELRDHAAHELEMLGFILSLKSVKDRAPFVERARHMKILKELVS